MERPAIKKLTLKCFRSRRCERGSYQFLSRCKVGYMPNLLMYSHDHRDFAPQGRS